MLNSKRTFLFKNALKAVDNDSSIFNYYVFYIINAFTYLAIYIILFQQF